MTSDLPTEKELGYLLKERSNWGRWGDDDQLGCLNLITPEKRVAAASLVRNGRNVSLSRKVMPAEKSEAGLVHCDLSLHQLDEKSVAAMDYFGLSYHGFSTTHIDALCHISVDGLLWNGRPTSDVLQTDGASWGDIEQWCSGIFTRGLLLDVPGSRGTRYVTPEEPVMGIELENIAKSKGMNLQAGDAILVHSGRAAWNDENEPWETLGPRWVEPSATSRRPGLHASCMEFLRDNDVAVLLWDMMDMAPSGYSLAWSVHGAIRAFGLALIDNVSFDEVLLVSEELERSEFLLVAAPLRVCGGTGCPINPLAIF